MINELVTQLDQPIGFCDVSYNYIGTFTYKERESIKILALPKIKHLVIDIETLGTRIDSEVVEVAVLGLNYLGHVVFTWTAMLRKTTNAYVDQTTIDWHNSNGDLLDRWITEQASDRLAYAGLVILDLMELFSHLNSDTLIWSYGLNFDYPLLQTLALRIDKELSIKNYRNLRCLRTYHETAKLVGFNGCQDFHSNKSHSALADCFNEAYLLDYLLDFYDQLELTK